MSQHLTRLESPKCRLDFGPALPVIIPEITHLQKLHLGANLLTSSQRPIRHLQHLMKPAAHAPEDLLGMMEVVAPIKSLGTPRLMKQYLLLGWISRKSSSCFPIGDISLMMPNTLVDMSIGSTEGDAVLDAGESLRAVRAAPALAEIGLGGVLTLPPYSDAEDE
eukprot:jgi/Tetstr1/423918/TSEL_014541.t1